MRFLNYITEKYLASEAKFGFELEAFIHDSKFSDLLDYTTKPLFDGIVLEDLEEHFIKGGAVVKDGSLEHEDKDFYPFEYQSPAIQFTPQNIVKFKEFLKYINSDNSGYTTNSSCGFHVHVSFPKIDTADMGWYLCQLALDDAAYDKIKKLKEINFFEHTYASTDIITTLKTLIIDKRFGELSSFITESKYNIIRLHPQGTIEWRGPRNFLNNKNSTENINDFISLLYFFISDMSKKISLTDLNGLDKEDFKKLNIKKIFDKSKFKIKHHLELRDGATKYDLYKNNPWFKNLEGECGYLVYNNKILNIDTFDIHSSKIINTLLTDGELNSCNVENCKLIKVNSNKSTIVDSKIETGKYSKTALINCKLNGGVYLNVSVDKCYREPVNKEKIYCRFFSNTDFNNSTLYNIWIAHTSNTSTINNSKFYDLTCNSKYIIINNSELIGGSIESSKQGRDNKFTKIFLKDISIFKKSIFTECNISGSENSIFTDCIFINCNFYNKELITFNNCKGV